MSEADNGMVVENDPTVTYIRKVLRDIVKNTRKDQRRIELNKYRSILGEKIEHGTYDLQFVEAAAKTLRRKSLTVQEYKKLQNALIQSEEHINTFLKADNAIHGLVRDLSGTSTKSKYFAASCCCNIALGNSKACSALSKYTAPYLIAELESTSEPLAEVCIWTVGNLVNGSSKAFSIFHAQDCIKNLIHLVEHCSVASLPIVSYATLNYIHAGHDVIDSQDFTGLASVYIQRISEIQDIDSFWALALLSSNQECQDVLIPISKLMCDYIFKANVEEVETIEQLSAALRIMSNLVNENSAVVAKYILLENETNSNFDKLLNHPYLHVRKEALWMLGNLCKHSKLNLSLSSFCSENALKLAIKSVNGEIMST